MHTIISTWPARNRYPGTGRHAVSSRRPPTFKGQGPERTAGPSLWLYPVVWLWDIRQKPDDRYVMPGPWYSRETMPGFADAIAWLWPERIQYMFGHAAGQDKKFEFLPEALAPAA